MASLASGLHLSNNHAPLSGAFAQRRSYLSAVKCPFRNLSYCGVRLAHFDTCTLTAGSNKVGFAKAKGPGPCLVRCHTETPVLESVDRAACPSVKAEIDPSAFSAVDLRVGLITDAKPVLDPGMSAKRGKPTDSRRYLQLTVDIGCETRTVVSECKYVMDVEDAVGKKVLVVANVPPAEILGIRSHGVCR